MSGLTRAPSVYYMKAESLFWGQRGATEGFTGNNVASLHFAQVPLGLG